LQETRRKFFPELLLMNETDSTYPSSTAVDLQNYCTESSASHTHTS